MMGVDFTLNNIMSVLADTFFQGNVAIAGLAVMLAVFLVFVVILANVKAPPLYAVVPMIPLAVMFAALGIMDANLSFFIIVVTAVIVAVQARSIAEGGRRWV